jgi:uncharacterized membrane protein HdeD (DUF308 family)
LIELKAPGWLRILEILGGVVAIFAATLVYAYPGLTVETLIFIFGIAMLVVGLVALGVGVFGRHLLSPLRGFSAGAGIVVAVLSLVPLLEPQLIGSLLIVVLAVALLLAGVAGVTMAGFARQPPVWVRGVGGAVGLLIIILAVDVLLNPSLGESLLALLVALGLLFVGLRNIAWGVRGHRHLTGQRSRIGTEV